MAFMIAMTVPALAMAATVTEEVKEPDVSRQAENTPPLKDWVIYKRNAGEATFVTGPETAPLGAGSLELSTPTGADKIYAFNYDHTGTALSDVNAISYSTYRSAGNLQQVAALNVEVDVNGPEVAGGYTVLVFEPVYNTDQGAVVNDEWQEWDALNGGDAVWWSTKAITGTCAFTCYDTWSEIVANNPDATILGGFGVNQGSGNPALVTAVDALTLGAGSDLTVYDFEPVITVANKQACKNDGWKTSNTPVYKNQGDCVSAFASQDKAKGNPSVVQSVVSTLSRLF